MDEKAIRHKLRSLAIMGHNNAYAPYSKFSVGSAILTNTEKYYFGCNIENQSFGGTVCAERIAIFKGISEGAQSIKQIYIYTKNGCNPCGLCRQVISEFSTDETTVIIGNEKNEEKVYLFNEIFPYASGPFK